MKPFLIPALLFLAAIAVYAPTLKYDFVYDDNRQIELMESRFTFSQLPSYFTTDVWSYLQQKSSNYYRPLFVTWLMLTYQVAGLNHPIWHAEAILLHALSTLLLFFLARRLTGSVPIAALGALMFAVDPVHVECVAWVSGATESISAILFFSTLLLFLAARQHADPARARWLRTGSLAMFFATLLAKETGAVLPALIAVYIWLFPQQPQATEAATSKRVRLVVDAVVPYVQVLLIYFAVRYLVLRGFSAQFAPWSIKSRIATLPEVVWYYMHTLAWPVRLSLFPPLAAVHYLGFENFWLPALGSALGIAVLIWIWRSGPQAAFWVAMLALPMLPPLYLGAFWPDDFAHDRYLYLPSTGFYILLAMAIWRLPNRGLPNEWRMAVIAPLIAVLAWFTILQSRVWRDTPTLAAHVVKIAPDSAPADELQGSSFMLQERYAEALPWLEKEAALNAEDRTGNLELGACYFRLGNFSKAIGHFQGFLAKVPDSPQANLLLGLAEIQTGEIADAEAHMREAVRLRPRASVQYRGYRSSLAELLERKGDLPGALEEYNRELEEYPDESGVFDRAMVLKKRIGGS